MVLHIARYKDTGYRTAVTHHITRHKDRTALAHHITRHRDRTVVTHHITRSKMTQHKRVTAFQTHPNTDDAQ